MSQSINLAKYYSLGRECEVTNDNNIRVTAQPSFKFGNLSHCNFDCCGLQLRSSAYSITVCAMSDDVKLSHICVIVTRYIKSRRHH